MERDKVWPFPSFSDLVESFFFRFPSASLSWGGSNSVTPRVTERWAGCTEHREGESMGGRSYTADSRRSNAAPGA